ncbi:MAG: lipopolysaccharide biosynthesis protein [Acidobacteriota bacterium]
MPQVSSEASTRPSFLRTFLVYGTGEAIRRVAGLLLFPIYTRLLTPHDYGILSLVGACGSLSLTLLGMGIPTSIFRFYLREEGEEGRRQVLRACLNLVGLALLPALILAGASRPLAQQILGDADLWLFLVLILIATYGDLLSKVPLAPIRARQQSGLYVTLTTSSLLVTLLLSVTFVVVLRWGVFGILLAQALVAGVWSLILLAHLLRQGIPRTRPGMMGQVARYGLPLVLAALAQFLLNLSDRFILKLFVPLSELGLYAVGYRLAEGITIATTVFSFTWVPFAFGEMGTPEGKQRMAKVGTAWFGLVLLAGTGIAVFSRELIQVLTGPSFHDAAPVVPVVVVGLTLSAAYPISSMGLQLADRTGYLPYLNAAAAALNLVLNFLWIPVHGIQGAAWATAAAYALLFGSSLLLSQRAFRLPISHARWGAGILMALVAGASGLWAARFGDLGSVFVKSCVLALLFGGFVSIRLVTVKRLRVIFDQLRRGRSD